MSANRDDYVDYPEEIDNLHAELEYRSLREFQEVLKVFAYCVDLPRGLYLCNKMKVIPKKNDTEMFFEVSMEDVWVGDRERENHFVPSVKVYTFGDVHVESLRSEEEMAMRGFPPPAEKHS